MARRRKGYPVNGWINLLKPAGLGSTPAVSCVRRLTQAAKAGHAGTLDPAATGVLPIALGEATKTIPWVQAGQKIYDVTIAWGRSTTTDDSEGETVDQSDHKPMIADVVALLPEFIGTIMQLPPDYSAIHLDGKRAYDLARDGLKPELVSRPVRIDRIEYIGQESWDQDSRDQKSGIAAAESAVRLAESKLRVWTGKGVYIRSLARDLGRRLGCFGHVKTLERVRCGNFSQADAISLDALRALAHKTQILSAGDSMAALGPILLPITAGLDDIPVRLLAERQVRQMASGQAIPLRETSLRGGTAHSLGRVCHQDSGHQDSGHQDCGQTHDRQIHSRPHPQTYEQMSRHLSVEQDILSLHSPDICLVCSEIDDQPIALAKLDRCRLQPVRVFNLSVCDVERRKIKVQQ